MTKRYDAEYPVVGRQTDAGCYVAGDRVDGWPAALNDLGVAGRPGTLQQQACGITCIEVDLGGGARVEWAFERCDSEWFEQIDRSGRPDHRGRTGSPSGGQKFFI